MNEEETYEEAVIRAEYTYEWFKDKVHEQYEEIERLKKRERKWEKWETEKSILSTKMCEYLCKYSNLKREYTKLVGINTFRKSEIERLNNIINELESDVNAIVFLLENGESREIALSILNKIKELKEK